MISISSMSFLALGSFLLREVWRVDSRGTSDLTLLAASERVNSQCNVGLFICAAISFSPRIGSNLQIATPSLGSFHI